MDMDNIYVYIYIYVCVAGWWYAYPSEKYEFVNWVDEIPIMWNMFQTTNQLLLVWGLYNKNTGSFPHGFGPAKLFRVHFLSIHQSWLVVDKTPLTSMTSSIGMIKFLTEWTH